MNDNDYVWCVQVRSADPPQFIAEDGENLDDYTGDLLAFEQCDGCGNCAYQLKRDGKQFYAVCTDDPDDEFSHHQPCGAHYRVYRELAREVAF
jgi:hypothetical protein